MRNLFACLVSLFTMLSFSSQLSAQQSEATPAASGTATSQVPRLIKFSGTLLDRQGQPLRAPVGVTFSLYAQQSGDAPLWMETQNVEPDANGDYIVLLGSNSAKGVPVELFASAEARWLGVQPEGQIEQSRVLLVSVPYALKAGDAETLGGKPASAFALSGPLVGSAGNTSASPAIIAPMAAATPPGASADGGNAGNAAIGNASTCATITADGTALANQVVKFSAPCQIHQSRISDNGTSVSVAEPLNLPAVAAATSASGQNSFSMNFAASAFNSSTHLPVSQNFHWQAEPVGSNTSSPSGKLNLLFASGTGTPAETGLSVSNKGLFTFAQGQAYSGNGAALTNVNAAQLGGVAATGYAKLAAANLFTQPQTIKTGATGNLLSVQGTGAGAGSLTVDKFGNITNSGVIVAGNDINTSGFMFSNGLDSTGPATLHNGLAVAGNSSFSGAITGTTMFNGPVGIGKTPGHPFEVEDTSTNTTVVVTGNTGSAGGVMVVDNKNTASDALIAVFNSAAGGVNIKCTIDNLGNLACRGSKSAVVSVANDHLVTLYAVEAPENWFEDYGSATLTAGAATIRLDPVFLQTVNTTMTYHVFLTPKGDCRGLYVTNETDQGFEVRELNGGTSNVAFDYRIIAHRRGYEHIRLADVTDRMKSGGTRAIK
jgi:hypothetical protein